MSGKFDILGAQAGHDELVFKDAKEAKTKVDELLGKRYAIMVEHGGTTHKVTGFDEATGEYLAKGETEVRIPMADSKPTAIAPTSAG